ncbi:NUDIX hydrolase [Nocardia sp. CA-107356]|uniref:NUDIX hydrolase n=1 Tax=Nocardia sp. CA-107356 TaxID=3239972 RepID=UPI003D8A4556
MPAADAVRLCAAAFVQSGEGTVLLICGGDEGNWSMPGGRHEPGESLSDTAVRATREQTAIGIHLTGLVGIFTTLAHLTANTRNDEAGRTCTIVYRGEPVTGEPTPSSESAHIEWVSIGAIADLSTNPVQRERIDWALTQPEPHIDVPTR